MKLLYQKLTDYFAQRLPEGYRNNFYSWTDKGEIVNEGKDITERGEMLFVLEYTAELFFHELPFKKIDPLYLMAHLNQWLAENDSERDAFDEYRTPFDLTLLSDDTADLSFSIKFREPIYFNKDRAELTGNKFEFGDLSTDVEIWTAETVQNWLLFVNNTPVDRIKP